MTTPCGCLRYLPHATAPSATLGPSPLPTVVKSVFSVDLLEQRREWLENGGCQECFLQQTISLPTAVVSNSIPATFVQSTMPHVYSRFTQFHTFHVSNHTSQLPMSTGFPPVRNSSPASVCDKVIVSECVFSVCVHQCPHVVLYKITVVPHRLHSYGYTIHSSEELLYSSLELGIPVCTSATHNIVLYTITVVLLVTLVWLPVYDPF